MATAERTGAIDGLRRVSLVRDGEALSDAELLSGFVNRADGIAFEVLVRRHGPMVLGVCRRLLRHPQDAEDAFQATFLVLARKAASLTRRDLLANWLHGVARRAALEVLSKRPRRETAMIDLPEPARPDEPAPDDLHAVLDEELGRLPEKYRLAVVMCDLGGRTRRDVARQLGLPEGTLSGRLTTAHRILAKRLARRGVALSTGALMATTLPTPLIASTIHTVATAAAPHLAAITEGVLRTMFLTKLKTTALVAMLVVGVGSGGWLVRSAAFAEGQPAKVADGGGPKALTPRQVELERSKEVKAATERLQNYDIVIGELQDKLETMRLKREQERTRLETLKIMWAVPYDVHGAKLEVEVIPERPTIMLGEPTFFRYRVKNPSGLALKVATGGDYRNRLGRPESFRIEVTREDGTPVPQPDAGMSLGGIGGYQPLPDLGHYDFGLFLPHWATFSEPGVYTISCRRTLELVGGDAADPFKEKPVAVDTAARTTITVVAKDDRKFGELIDTLGKAMLDRTTEGAERAEKMLVAIQDDRAVPYFVKLAEQPHQSPRMTAAGALAKFNTDAAFAALKTLTKTTAADVRGGSTTLELAKSSADGVRHAAIVAISQCNHPAAVPFLWSQVDDPYYGVRVTVLHKAAEENSAEARAIIEKLTEDANETVRNEAVRYRIKLAKEGRWIPPKKAGRK